MDNNLIKFIDVMNNMVVKGDGIYPADATQILAEVILLLEATLDEWPMQEFEGAIAHFKDVIWVMDGFEAAGWRVRGEGDDV